MEDYNLYWGDIHGHNELCDGKGTTAEYLEHGRDISKLDFCALTPHDIWLNEEKWSSFQKSVKQYHKPDKFVVLNGRRSCHKSGWQEKAS